LASLWDEEETQDPEAKKIADIDSLHAPVIKVNHIAKIIIHHIN
jgi:hypothetical protein